MSKNYMNDSQASEIVKYISDTMKFPIMGAGGGFAPIGTINSYMGTVAPIGWLVCDGTVYNISDYPDLATHIASQFGSADFFGGNGTTTFAVPDLRGEFLRGTGTNSHMNQGDGANVGEHQDGTAVLDVFTDATNGNVAIIGRKSSGESHIENSDSSYGGGASGVYSSGAGTFTGSDAYYTTRPTNTSVLFIIKATLSDAEINAFNVYTPREHQVAWWEEEIDGVWKRKPVYEKVVHIGNLGTSGNKTFSHGIQNIEDVLYAYGWSKKTGTIEYLSVPFAANSNSNVQLWMTTKDVFNINVGDSRDGYDANIVIRYTKTTDDWQTS